MKRDNRQILVNPHSADVKVPKGALNLGEIGVQHTNVEDAALYVETVGDSESAETVAKFITDKAIEKIVASAQTDLQTKIDAINDAVGLPHSGTTGDTHHWDETTTVWDAIEETYAEMAAGTAAANTKVEKAGNADSVKFMTLSHVTDQETSSITYTIGLDKISEAIDSAYTIVNEKVTELSAGTIHEVETLTEMIEELSAATDDVISNLDTSGIRPDGRPVVNVTEENGLVTPVLGDIEAEYVTIADAGGVLTSATVEGALQEIAEKVNRNEVASEDESIIVVPGSGSTDLSVNVDGETIVKGDDGALMADLKLSAVTPSSVNVREEFALIDHNGQQLGDTVKVYKDTSLYGVFLGHVDDTLSDPEDPESLVSGSGDTALDLIYHKEDGTYELVALDVNDFLEESEFKDGLDVDNHVVKVKVDENSEEVVIGDSGLTAPVLSVGEDGVKISNILAAIDYAVETLAHNVDADVKDMSEDGRVAVEVVQTDTELAQVIVTTTDIASSEAVGLTEDGSFVPDPTSNFASAATSVRNEIKLIDQALKEVSEKLNNASVVESGSTENWVAVTVAEVEPGTTAITLDDTALANELLEIHNEIEEEAQAREDADQEIIGNSASTSADTSLMGIKKLIEQITTSVVKDITIPTGETLIEVSKEDTPEGDLYTISSSEKLNDAIALAETSVQEIGFQAVADKDETVYGSNVGAEIVDAENGGKKIALDLSLLKVDCGEY